LRVGETVVLKEGIAAALDGVVEREQDDEEIVLAEIGLHDSMLLSNDLMANDVLLQINQGGRVKRGHHTIGRLGSKRYVACCQG
jgi:hypothetical protein